MSNPEVRPPSRPQHIELFAAAAVKPEALWELVSDLRRLPEWTDADEVEVGTGPVDVGTAVMTRTGSRRLTWTVVTREPRVLELRTALERGSLGIGVSVVREAMGARARIILAAEYQPASRSAALRFRLAGATALRRRFDGWTRRALHVAGRSGSHP